RTPALRDSHSVPPPDHGPAAAGRARDATEFVPDNRSDDDDQGNRPSGVRKGKGSLDTPLEAAGAGSLERPKGREKHETVLVELDRAASNSVVVFWQRFGSVSTDRGGMSDDLENAVSPQPGRGDEEFRGLVEHVFRYAFEEVARAPRETFPDEP